MGERRLKVTACLIGIAILLAPFPLAQAQITEPRAVEKGGYNCPDPPERADEPVCCRVTLDISATGAVEASSARCTHPAYSETTASCQGGRKWLPAERDGKPVSHRWTFDVYHFKQRPSFEELRQVRSLCDDTETIG